MNYHRTNVFKIISFFFSFLFFGLIGNSAKHAENYIFVTKWTGNSNGQLNAPKGEAVDSSGIIYVIDMYNDLIQKLSSVKLGTLGGEYI